MAEKSPLIFNLLFMDKILLTLIKHRDKQNKIRNKSMFGKNDKKEMIKYNKILNVLDIYLELKYNF